MLKTIKTKQELIQTRSLIKAYKKIALVPTMGNLHQGHLSLISQASHENDVIFISIFVNPLQFGEKSDLERYPRTLEEDIKKIKSLHLNKEIFIFSPKTVYEVFPTKSMTQIVVTPINDMIEGEKRPGHFNGVTTVVHKLFQLTRPHEAFFGKKDFQQFVIIKKMARDLELEVKVIGCEIIRNQEGMALSSRNQFLTPKQKLIGLNLRKSLLKLKNEFKEMNSENLEMKINQTNQKIKSLVSDDEKWDYLELRDAKNLLKPKKTSTELVLLGVYKVGTVRLLDNISF